MEQLKSVRDRLPAECRQSFDDIIEGRVLGASRHIRMIGDMMLAVARSASEHKFADCIALAEYFKERRGKSSYAFISAMNLLTRGFAAQDGPDTSEEICRVVEGYFADAQANTKKVVEYACRLAEPMQTILVFDYSSTVEKFVTALDRPRTVIIPESRAIDGGKPFVESFVKAGHRVQFIPDAAMLTVLDEVDGVFIGAETYYPDGTAFNTVGSDILAELCRTHHVPYYVLTPLIKIDMRAARGIFKPIIGADLSGRLAADWPEELRSAVDFYSIELVGIPPQLITAFVTEEGILPPAAMYAVAKDFNDKTNEVR